VGRSSRHEIEYLRRGSPVREAPSGSRTAGAESWSRARPGRAPSRRRPAASRCSPTGWDAPTRPRGRGLSQGASRGDPRAGDSALASRCGVCRRATRARTRPATRCGSGATASRDGAGSAGRRPRASSEGRHVRRARGARALRGGTSTSPGRRANPTVTSVDPHVRIAGEGPDESPPRRT